jgi:Ca-activated chloride channel family protein
VRIEEMVNYFDYDYSQPKDDHPFNIITEISAAPWNQKHKLVHIGLQGKIIPTENLPPSNLVFLIDVSGSMDAPNKLPLLKSSFKMLVNELREKDHVSIVVYAGAAGLVLEPTSGAEKKKIMEAFDKLQAGGSTAGGAGINLAYSALLRIRNRVVQ